MSTKIENTVLLPFCHNKYILIQNVISMILQQKKTDQILHL